MRRELESLVDEWAPAFAADERTRGVSTLKAQSRCPFRGFAETRLRTEALDRPIPGFNERERGELLHDALERIWSVLMDSKRLAALGAGQRTDLLDRSVRAAIETLCRRRDPGARWRERERIRLNAILGKWLELEALRAPFAGRAPGRGRADRAARSAAWSSPCASIGSIGSKMARAC